MVRSFQLLLSLRNISLDPNNGADSKILKQLLVLMNIKMVLNCICESDVNKFFLSLGRDVTSSMPEIYPCTIDWHVDVCGSDLSHS